MTIPHNSGNLGNQIWSSPSQLVEEKDLSTGYVVGQDNYSGQTIVYDGSVTSKGVSDRSPELGKQVNIVRPDSQQKVRNITLNYSENGVIKTLAITQFTGTDSNTKDINSCGQNFNSNTPPSPPGSPPSDPPEDEETPEPEIIAQTDTLKPKVCQDTPPTRTGCKPRSTIQWFKAPRYTGACPLGSIENGYRIDEQGVEWISCKSPILNIGDGCPTDPTAMGYDCSECGTCVKVQGGKYPTLSACQQSNCSPITYTCTPSGCEAVFDGTGEFTSLTACNTSCSAVPYKCVDGNCIQALDGKFATLVECESECNTSTITQIEFTNTYTFASTDNGCSTVSRTNVTLTGGRRPFLGETLFTHADKASPGFLGCADPAYLDISFVANSGTASTGWVLLFSSDQGDFSYFVSRADAQTDIINIIITPL